MADSLTAAEPAVSEHEPFIEKPAEPVVLPDNEPFVAELSGPQRLIKILAASGVFFNRKLGRSDDEAQGAVLLAKRVNAVLQRDFSNEEISPELLRDLRETQNRCRKLLDEGDYNAWCKAATTPDGWLDAYLTFLIGKSTQKRDRLKDPNQNLKSGDERNCAILRGLIDSEDKKLEDLKREQNTYRNGGEYTQNMLMRIEPLVKLGRYVPLGQLVIESGLVEGEKPFVRDLVYDMLAVHKSRQLLWVANRMETKDYIEGLEKKFAQNPSDPDVQARAGMIALAMRQATQPLSAFEFEKESPELDAVTALHQLVSARINKAFGQERSTGQLIELEKQSQAMLQEAAQVILSKTLDYLETGPAKDDSRIRTVRENLRNEMARYGIVPLKAPTLGSKAAAIAEACADDLLVGMEANAKLTGKIKALAVAAGVPEKTPLAANATLIGKEIADLQHDLRIVLPSTLVDKMTVNTVQPAAPALVS